MKDDAQHFDREAVSGRGTIPHSVLKDLSMLTIRLNDSPRGPRPELLCDPMSSADPAAIEVDAAFAITLVVFAIIADAETHQEKILFKIAFVVVISLRPRVDPVDRIVEKAAVGDAFVVELLKMRASRFGVESFFESDPCPAYCR